LSKKLDVEDAKKLELLKQHIHELIEAKNKELRENEEEMARLQKASRVISK
jgi:hypothetical protein